VPLLLIVLCIVGPTVSTYVSSYMTSYAIVTLKLAPDIGMAAALFGYIASLAGIPLGAWAADRYGAKISILVPRIIFVLIVYQAYLLITAEGATLETFLLVNIGLNFILALAQGGLYALVTQALPKSVRSSGLSIGYAISVTVFGGSTQAIVTWLIAELHDPLVPAWYQIAANLVSIVAVMLIVAHKGAKPTVEIEAPG
jgi:MFS family permease